MAKVADIERERVAVIERESDFAIVYIVKEKAKIFDRQADELERMANRLEEMSIRDVIEIDTSMLTGQVKVFRDEAINRRNSAEELRGRL